ncbi:MAG: thermonuclease family protein [Polaromonas sp.]|uniref:thermonuclease family protein n=1 Tax=Polaromonas sp. TaxID=1869339 RepID=UPI002735E7B3|nr:thermonuclease family protein [Polaromonas sp.]MDP2819775.1 thermonuclease family protein [Polaromonas sp.]
MTGLRACAAWLVLWGAVSAQAGGEWSGTVTRIADGDTLWVRPAFGGRPVKLRVHGIDAPEICQTGGQASRAALAHRLAGQRVQVSPQRKDDYGRTVAVLHREGEDIAGWMVGQGHAWSYRFGRDGGPYRAQQAHAQASARGLFADPLAVEPRLFRKRHGSCDPAGLAADVPSAAPAPG